MVPLGAPHALRSHMGMYTCGEPNGIELIN